MGLETIRFNVILRSGISMLLSLQLQALVLLLEFQYYSLSFCTVPVKQMSTSYGQAAFVSQARENNCLKKLKQMRIFTVNSGRLIGTAMETLDYVKKKLPSRHSSVDRTCVSTELIANLGLFTTLTVKIVGGTKLWN